MRLLTLVPVAGIAAAVAFSSTAASASDFSLPSVTIANPTCTVFDDICSLQAGPVATSSGTFSIDMASPALSLPAPITSPSPGVCWPMLGSATLTFTASPDTLVLKPSGGDTLCFTQPLNPLQSSTPWPVKLTMSVDGAKSSGLYQGATGTGSIDGTWTTSAPCDSIAGNCAFSGDPSIVICRSDSSDCGISGEPINAFVLSSVSIADLQLQCTVDCSPGGGSEPPSPGQTPELDSLTLFGSALLSAAAYAGLRRRAARRG